MRFKERQVDRAAVLAAYEETKNGREVARRLGIHENTVYQIVRVTLGNCARCGAKAKHRYTMCEPCLIADRNRLKKNRADRLRRGLCQSCDKQRSPLSLMFCEAHRVAAAERKLESKARQKLLGAPGYSQGEKRRQQYILWKYGTDGVTCWNDAGGKCEVCKQTCTITALHIHHIDESKTNHERANLICLCHNCHTTVHGLLRSVNPKAMSDWFASTYSAKWG